MFKPSAKATRATLLSLVASMVVFASAPGSGLAQTAPTLGNAAAFAVLAGSTVTNTGPTTIRGSLGVSPGSAVTGILATSVTNGSIQAGNAVAAQAQLGVTAAYDNLASQPCTSTFPTQAFGNQTLTPGVYCFTSAALLTGPLVLDAQNNPNAVWVFKVASAITTATGSSVLVTNGGAPCNAFWQIGSSATLGTTTAFSGNILALTSITLNTGATVSGRTLARNGAVTMDSNSVNTDTCAAFTPPPPANTATSTSVPVNTATFTPIAASTSTQTRTIVPPLATAPTGTTSPATPAGSSTPSASSPAPTGTPGPTGSVEVSPTPSAAVTSPAAPGTTPGATETPGASATNTVAATPPAEASVTPVVSATGTPATGGGIFPFLLSAPATTAAETSATPSAPGFGPPLLLLPPPPPLFPPPFVPQPFGPPPSFGPVAPFAPGASAAQPAPFFPPPPGVAGPVAGTQVVLPPPALAQVAGERVALQTEMPEELIALIPEEAPELQPEEAAEIGVFAQIGRPAQLPNTGTGEGSPVGVLALLGGISLVLGLAARRRTLRN